MTRGALFQIVSDLALAIQGASAYPENHPRVQELMVRLHRQVQPEAERLQGLNIGFFRDHIVVDEFPFVEPNPTLTRLIERMREKGIEKILISGGITFGELKRFVHFLGDGTGTLSEQVWESIVYGRIEGAESAAADSLGLAHATRPSDMMAGAMVQPAQVRVQLRHQRAARCAPRIVDRDCQRPSARGRAAQVHAAPGVSSGALPSMPSSRILRVSVLRPQPSTGAAS
jgi:hypothetical protein